MRFVPVKSAEQQATLMLHKTREVLIKQQTMSVARVPNRTPGPNLTAALTADFYVSRARDKNAR